MLELPSHSCSSAAEPDRAERLVERAVELEHRRGEDPDHDGRVDRRQEDGGAEEAPTRDAPVDRCRRRAAAARPGSAPRGRRSRCCATSEKERVVPQHLEVVQADPLRGRDPVPAGERVEEDAPERVADEHDDQRHGRRRVEETPQPLRAAGPPPCVGCRRAADRLQGLSVFRPFSTFCIAWSAVDLAREGGLQLHVVEQRHLQRARCCRAAGPAGCADPPRRTS